MRKTTITILGNISASDFTRLDRTLDRADIRLRTGDALVHLCLSGTAHDHDLLVSRSPVGKALRELVSRGKCCLTSESDPGNGRPVSGMLLFKGPAVRGEAAKTSVVSYKLDQKTGRYAGISDGIAAKIESLRSTQTHIEGAPASEWLTAGLTALMDGASERRTRPLVLTDPLPREPLLLTEEMRVDVCAP